MKLTLRRDLGGYALPVVIASGIDGTIVEKPFVLLSGQNGSGKSAIINGIRASVGLQGDRAGSIETPMSRHLDPETAEGDIERLATHTTGFDGPGAARHVPAVFRMDDLGWRGNPIHLFDSRSTSSIGKTAEFGTDMMFEASLLMGGGRNSSHGQFVSKAWWEAIEWAAGNVPAKDPWREATPSPARAAVLKAALGEDDRSTERWLMIDEPETAIDVQTLIAGLAVLLEIAEIGRLRVFCASHSLLFAAGLADHPKVQTIDMAGSGASWMHTQRLAIRASADQERMHAMGRHMLEKMRQAAAMRGGSSDGGGRRKGSDGF